MPTDDSIRYLTAISFDQLLGRCNPFAGGECTFDLREARFISPAALVQLVASAHAIKKGGASLKLCVEDESVRTYLVRSGFLAAIEGVATIEPEYDDASQHRFGHLHGSNPLLLEVTRIANGAELPTLLDRIVGLLRTRLRYRKNDAYDVVTVISEVAQNTFDHNETTCGFLALQTYDPPRGGRFIEVGVADFGAGLRSTLQRNPTLRLPQADKDTIALAMRLGVSQHQDDPTRGTGLHHLLRIAHEHAGSVQIRSGNGKVNYRGDKQQAWRFTVPPMPGVQIAISMKRRAP
jgi:anti-anti-sigma regulatory factor/anti-sigma regulatory factor (Ser/Thr protein kinase)